MLKLSAVISALYHASTSQTLKDNAVLLRGEVDPWEASSLNNPLLLPGPEKPSFPKLCFPMGFSLIYLEMSTFPISTRGERECRRPLILGCLKMIKIGKKSTADNL